MTTNWKHPCTQPITGRVKDSSTCNRPGPWERGFACVFASNMAASCSDIKAKAKVRHLVADSAAFIKNAPLQEICEVVYTVQDVVGEIRDKATIQRLAVLPYDIVFREPSTEAISRGEWVELCFHLWPLEYSCVHCDWVVNQESPAGNLFAWIHTFTRSYLISELQYINGTVLSFKLVLGQSIYFRCVFLQNFP